MLSGQFDGLIHLKMKTDSRDCSLVYFLNKTPYYENDMSVRVLLQKAIECPAQSGIQLFSCQTVNHMIFFLKSCKKQTNKFRSETTIVLPEAGLTEEKSYRTTSGSFQCT